MRVIVFNTVAPLVIVDRSFQNASDYKVHHVTPGVYPAVWTDIDGRHTSPEKAYYLAVTVRTTLVERGGTDRLFFASRQRRDTPNTPDVYTERIYAFQIRRYGAPATILGGAHLEAGVSLDKVVPDYAAVRGVWHAHDEVTYRRGKALIDSKRTVSLDHPDLAPQRHAHIPGDKGMGELPPVWMDSRGHCDCRFHTTRERARWAAFRAQQRERKAKVLDSFKLP